MKIIQSKSTNKPIKQLILFQKMYENNTNLNIHFVRTIEAKYFLFWNSISFLISLSIYEMCYLYKSENSNKLASMFTMLLQYLCQENK